MVELAPDLHRERQEGHPLAPHDVPVVEDVAGDAVVLDEFLRRLGARRSEQNARQQLKELCEKFSADLTIAEVTDVLVPKGSFSFEFAVDGLRCGVGSARSKKEAKEQAAALALRALAREPPRDL